MVLPKRIERAAHSKNRILKEVKSTTWKDRIPVVVSVLSAPRLVVLWYSQCVAYQHIQ
jgi:hypothetical protein